jgi:DNA-binding transcriptional MerR regulator
MMSIGDLSSQTGVSVRRLRHYDGLGLVRPERIDPGTGYRWYADSQVGRVEAVLAARELGFTLAQCRLLLDEQVLVEELRELLGRRQAVLEQQIRQDTARLAEVGRRLRSLERGLTMTNQTLELKALPALRLAQVSAEVNDTSELPAMTRRLADELARRLATAGTPQPGPGIRTFYGRPDGSKIDVAVAVGVTDESLLPGLAGGGLELVDLPAEPSGAAVTHRGPARDVADAWHTIDVALEQRGLESHGVYRLVYLDEADSGDVVVELQCPVRPLGTGC